MSGAAQFEEIAGESWQATGTEGAPNLKQVAADRLAAHRQRRAAAEAQEAESEARTRQQRDAVQYARRDAQRRGATMVRDTVMARYQQRESYREFLAAEADRAIAQAQAEAEVATRSARAVAEAQMALLEEFDRINQPEPGPREQVLAQVSTESRGELAHALADIVMGAQELISEPPSLAVLEAVRAEPRFRTDAEPGVREISAAGLTVRLFEDIPMAPQGPMVVKPQRGKEPVVNFSEQVFDEQTAETLTALEEEIDFRRTPEFPRPTPLEVHSIPGNLLEFPRELVAPRRARPRLAEGPLHDTDGPQLRIFEVDTEAAAPEIAAAGFTPAPEWQRLQLSGFLEELPPPATATEAQSHIAAPLYIAPVERRLMSAAVDLCCIGTAWLLALACVFEIAGPALHSLPLPLAALSGFVALAVFAVMYQLLFFTFSESTLGMRYARIALCTFADGNPGRHAMRRRVLATFLAASPLGLGLAWMLLDSDRLGWHDRMSRMYQRAY